jgi:phosphomannomutase
VTPIVVQQIHEKSSGAGEEVLPAVVAAIKCAEQQLNGNGRVNVRYSGTELLARVMVEADKEETVRKIADMAKLMALAAKYNIDILGPLPELAGPEA